MTARRLVLLLIVVAVVAAALISAGKRFAGNARRSTAAIEPLPPVPVTEYLNTGPSANYVGADACAECHADQHHSWTETAHSRALADIDPAAEPPPGGLFDPKSGRGYQVYVEGHELRHCESARTGADESLVLADLPVRHVIGSGRFSRSYLVSRDGFLVESPVTWYAALDAWKLSPGYEQHNAGFERPINGECMGCHVGRAEPVDGAVQRFRIESHAIECERCHGPGSLHVKTRQADGAGTADSEATERDLTIVNPARLSRKLQEAVCAQCHLHSAATVELRGRSLADFRPSQRLEDFCIHYAFENPNREMRVVGHMEQMQLSPCYLGSDTLTCTTCHDPHAAAPQDSTERVEHYRAKCLECHTPANCGVPLETRVAAHPDDNCVTCHMPTSATDIPHFAFTHHRIGIHGPPSQQEEETLDLLLPLDDISHLPQIDRDRTAAIGYMRAADVAESPESAFHLQERAHTMLLDVRNRGLIDPEVDAALARLYWRADPERTAEFAESVLQQPQATPQSRVTALFALGTTRVQQGEYRTALPLLEELVTLRLSSEDWFMVSRCRQELQDIDGAITAAQRAAEIAPQYPQIQDHLAGLFDLAGRTADAEAARQRAEQLRGSSLRLPEAAQPSNQSAKSPGSLTSP